MKKQYKRSKRSVLAHLVRVAEENSQRYGQINEQFYENQEIVQKQQESSQSKQETETK